MSSPMCAFFFATICNARDACKKMSNLLYSEATHYTMAGSLTKEMVIRFLLFTGYSHISWTIVDASSLGISDTHGMNSLTLTGNALNVKSNLHHWKMSKRRTNPSRLFWERFLVPGILETEMRKRVREWGGGRRLWGWTWCNEEWKNDHLCCFIKPTAFHISETSWVCHIKVERDH